MLTGFSEHTKIFKILSDPMRFEIIRLLKAVPGGMCVNEIATAIGLSHSATSHQLAKLENRGLVQGERIGQMMCYMLTKSAFTVKTLRVMQSAFS